MSWPTGDTISAGWVAFRVLVPPDGWLIQILQGQLPSLTYSANWDGEGDITPSQASAVFDYAFRHLAVQLTTVGQVICFAADNMQYIGQNPINGPSQFLKCDGQLLATADFPDLFAVIGYTFGGSGPSFQVPDLRGRAVVDAGTGSGLTPRTLGDTFGEENHLLTSGEMPNHSHTYTAASTTAITIGPGAPAPSAVPAPGISGATGGGSAHNNLQPSLVLFYYIQWQP